MRYHRLPRLSRERPLHRNRVQHHARSNFGDAADVQACPDRMQIRHRGATGYQRQIRRTGRSERGIRSMRSGVDDDQLRAAGARGVEHPRQTWGMGRDRHGTVSTPQITPDARRSLRVQVDHHRAAACKFVRDGEADRDGGLSGATLL